MRCRVTWGGDLAAVRMYDSFPAIIKGWSRIFYAAKVGNPRHIVGAMWFLLSSCFTVYPALIYGVYRAMHPHGNMLDYAWVAAAALHLAVMTTGPGAHLQVEPELGPVRAAVPGGRADPVLHAVQGPGPVPDTKKLEWRGTSYSHAMNQNLAAKQM